MKMHTHSLWVSFALLSLFASAAPACSDDGGATIDSNEESLRRRHRDAGTNTDAAVIADAGTTTADAGAVTDSGTGASTGTGSADADTSRFTSVLEVGPGKPYAKPCAAIAVAPAGSLIEVDAAGNYDGDTCAWSTDDLTVRGVNGRPRIDLTGGTPAQQKGIFTIYAANATVENFELSGAAISASAGNNGAGIRHQGTNLTVRGCYFHDNQDGILGGPPTDGTGVVVIERSEFARNGAGDGQSHNMYLNRYAEFTLRASYSHAANVGHLVKSRAMKSNILYNRLTDESGGSASYELDLPNAGTATVVGNVIEQAATTQNGNIVAYGEEGVPAGWDTHLTLANNTLLNDRGAGTFVVDATSMPAVLTNNVFYGGGTVTSQTGAVQTTNFVGDPRFVDVASYDVRLAAGSPAIDHGTNPGAAATPTSEYVHVASEQPRPLVGAAIDIGAYEAR